LAANTDLSVHGPQEVAEPLGPASEQKDSPIGGGESIAIMVWVLVQRNSLRSGEGTPDLLKASS